MKEAIGHQARNYIYVSVVLKLLESNLNLQVVEALAIR